MLPAWTEPRGHTPPSLKHQLPRGRPRPESVLRGIAVTVGRLTASAASLEGLTTPQSGLASRRELTVREVKTVSRQHPVPSDHQGQTPPAAGALLRVTVGCCTRSTQEPGTRQAAPILAPGHGVWVSGRNCRRNSIWGGPAPLRDGNAELSDPADAPTPHRPALRTDQV